VRAALSAIRLATEEGFRVAGEGCAVARVRTRHPRRRARSDATTRTRDTRRALRSPGTPVVPTRPPCRRTERTPSVAHRGIAPAASMRTRRTVRRTKEHSEGTEPREWKSRVEPWTRSSPFRRRLRRVGCRSSTMRRSAPNLQETLSRWHKPRVSTGAADGVARRLHLSEVGGHVGFVHPRRPGSNPHRRAHAKIRGPAPSAPPDSPIRRIGRVRTRIDPTGEAGRYPSAPGRGAAGGRE
jgi:hypothetical protein